MSTIRGITGYGAYVPFRTLDRAQIGQMMGGGGGRGTRAVASFDEDTTSMGVEAARIALAGVPGVAPDALWFATADPAYLDRTNANTIHAALRLDRDRPAMDMLGSQRSAVGALRTALTGAGGSVLVVASDVRIGLPTSAEESDGGDAASAVLVGDGSGDAPVLAELLAAVSLSDEFVDRWRAPGERRSRTWEERFGEEMYVPIGSEAWKLALERAGLGATDVAVTAVTGLHGRAVRRLAGRLGVDQVADDLAATVGNTGAAHPGLLLAAMLDDAEPGQVIALVVLADGADVLLFRATDALASYRPARTLARLLEHRGPVTYSKFLAWRGVLAVQPPNRPEPARPSSSASHRRADWKYGFVGARDPETGSIHLPPSRVSFSTGSQDAMDPAPMADALGTVVTFTIDRLAYSPSPPIVFAVVDFDGGGRMPVELTDVDPDGVEIGTRVEMTFRRLFTADGIHNYFWKGRPVRA
jgi:hydroxymethylglutaryl-CoA synthase